MKEEGVENSRTVVKMDTVEMPTPPPPIVRHIPARPPVTLEEDWDESAGFCFSQPQTKRERHGAWKYGKENVVAANANRRNVATIDSKIGVKIEPAVVATVAGNLSEEGEYESENDGPIIQWVENVINCLFDWLD